MQLPFWAFTGLFFYRAVTRGRRSTGSWPGSCWPGAFWSKYAAFALAATLGLFLLIDPIARRAWRTPGPYLMATGIRDRDRAECLVADRARLPAVPIRGPARAAVRALVRLHRLPLQWIGGQVLFLLPASNSSSCSTAGDVLRQPAADGAAAFARRIVTVLALGPFLVTTLVRGRARAARGRDVGLSAVVVCAAGGADVGGPGRRGAPAALVRGRFHRGLCRLSRHLRGGRAGEPFVRDRPRRPSFPGRLLAETITRQWRERTGTPLRLCRRRRGRLRAGRIRRQQCRRLFARPPARGGPREPSACGPGSTRPISIGAARVLVWAVGDPDLPDERASRLSARGTAAAAPCAAPDPLPAVAGDRPLRARAAAALSAAAGRGYNSFPTIARSLAPTASVMED